MFAFERRGSSRVPDVLREIVPDVLSLLLKEERIAECLMSCGRLFQMCGPKCEKVRKPWASRLKRWSLSMRVSDAEERSELEGPYCNV